MARLKRQALSSIRLHATSPQGLHHTVLESNDHLLAALRGCASSPQSPCHVPACQQVSMNQMMQMAAGFEERKIGIKHIPGPEGVRGRYERVLLWPCLGELGQGSGVLLAGPTSPVGWADCHRSCGPPVACFGAQQGDIASSSVQSRMRFDTGDVHPLPAIVATCCRTARCCQPWGELLGAMPRVRTLLVLGCSPCVACVNGQGRLCWSVTASRGCGRGASASVYTVHAVRHDGLCMSRCKPSAGPC
jgi:hypothetical protein